MSNRDVDELFWGMEAGAEEPGRAGDGIVVDGAVAEGYHRDDLDVAPQPGTPPTLSPQALGFERVHVADATLDEVAQALGRLVGRMLSKIGWFS